MGREVLYGDVHEMLDTVLTIWQTVIF